MKILGIDTGSRWCALAALVGDEGKAISVRAAVTIDINPTGAKPNKIDVGPIGAALLSVAASEGSERIIVEHSETWAPWPGMSHAAMHATQANWALCDRIVRELQRLSPVPVEILHARTWRSRVIPKGEKPAEPLTGRARKESADARVADALASRLDAASVAVLSAIHAPCDTATHQRDAAGVAIGYLLTPPPVAARAPRVKRDPSAPRPGRSASRNAAWLARRSTSRADAKVAKGCTMGCSRRHARACPAFRPMRYRAGPDPLDVLLGLEPAQE